MVRQECFNPEGLAQRAIRNVKQAAVGLARLCPMGGLANVGWKKGVTNQSYGKPW